jgi:hypothetical protein
MPNKMLTTTPSVGGNVVVESGTSGPAWFFDRTRLRTLGVAAHDAYRNAGPYPHAVVDTFLGNALAASLTEAFPSPAHPDWVRRDYREQSARLGQLQRKGFEGVDPALRHLLAEFSGMAFLDFLFALTNIEGLIPDAHFRGAGPSLTLPSGHLSLHADFNRDRTRHLERKLTVMYYFGNDWNASWGGDLELWNAERTRCEARYLPIQDRLIVMAHGDSYWHGHPTPLACPSDRYRASIAAYYYVAKATSDDESAHGAIWAAREDEPSL